MLDIKIDADPRKWFSFIRSWWRNAARRRNIQFHARLVDVLVRFRTGDYVKHVIFLSNPDRRKVVETELSQLLSVPDYLGSSAEKLATIIEREIQIRMADDHVWYGLACLAHAVHFPIQGRLIVRWQLGCFARYIPDLAMWFPFLNQPIEAVAPPNIAAQPTGMGQLSRELRGMLRDRLARLSVPKIWYAFSSAWPGPSPDLHEGDVGDVGVNILPEGWKPDAEERN